MVLGGGSTSQAASESSRSPSKVVCCPTATQRPTSLLSHASGRARAITQPPRHLSEGSDEFCDDEVTSEEVIRRIERLVEAFVCDLDDGQLPVLSDSCAIQDNERERTSNGRLQGNGCDSPDVCRLSDKTPALQKRFTQQQCRSYTSLLVVASFCHSLLRSRRTTTLREVYYHFVTHFRSQNECNTAISQVASVLRVPRHALGLKASPRGYFSGDLQLVDKVSGRVVLDGRGSAGSTSSSQGYPIESHWLLSPALASFAVQTVTARCILVVESEGVFHRLCEDGLVARQPCILITSRGFPDFATRAMVATLHRQLGLPVFGLADCNPFGASVLNTFVCQAPTHREPGRSVRFGTSASPHGIPHMHWLGLRPSQVETLRDELPPAVFQELTPRDEKRLELLLDGSWVGGPQSDRRREELESMGSYKVELEALNWLEMDALTAFVDRALEQYFVATADARDAANDDESRDSNIQSRSGSTFRGGNDLGSGSIAEDDSSADETTGRRSSDLWLDVI